MAREVSGWRVPGAPPAGGFTLIEVLVALLVCGFLLASVAQGTRFGLLAWANVIRTTRGSDELDIMDSTVRLMIESVAPGDGVDPAPMSGGSDRFRGVVAFPSSSGGMPGRRMDAELGVDHDHRLVLRWRPYIHGTVLGRAGAPNETELLSGVARVEFFYWSSRARWVSTWNENELPALVRVRLRFPDGDPRHWPDIVAAPRLDHR